MAKKKTYNINPEEFDRPKTLTGLHRIYDYLKISSIARKIPTCKAPSTFISRVNRHSRLDSTTDQKAFAHDTAQFFNEMFWELGVFLGHFPNDPEKKYKFLYSSKDEKATDRLDKYDVPVE